MQAIGYVRVSTAGQADDGVSLEAQEARIRAWATGNGADLLAVHIDRGLSGKRADNRPGLQAALAQTCQKKAALVVYSLSRLSRSIQDTCAIGEKLGKSGAVLVSLSEQLDGTSASGRLMLHMLTVLSQFEREQIGERTRTAMQHMRSQGRRISRFLPFGFALAVDGVTLLELPEEQASVKLMGELRAAGWSLRAIAGDLERRGIPTKTGRTWSATVVKGIIERTRQLRAAA